MNLLSKPRTIDRPSFLAGLGLRPSLHRIWEGSFLRGVVLLTSGTFLSQLIQLVCAPFLTRLYHPSELGAMAVFFSIVTLLAVLAALRFEVVIPLPRDDAEAAHLLVLSLLSIVLITTSLSIFIGVQGDTFVSLSHAAVPRDLLPFLPLGVGLASLYAVFSNWLVRQRSYRAIAGNSVIQSAFQMGSQIVLGIFGVGLVGLVMSEIFARSCGCGLLANRCWEDSRASLRQVRLAGVVTVAQRYWRFPVFSSGAAVLNVAGVHAPLLLFALLYDVHIVGWIALAQRILGAPTSLLSSAVARVYFSECARLRHESREKLLPLFYKTVVTQSAVGLLMFVGIALPAPWLCGLLFGSEWELAGWCVLALSVMFVAKLIAYPVGSTLDVFELQGWHLFREFVRILCTGLTFLLATIERWEPLTTVAVFSVSATLPYLLGVAIVWHVLRRVPHENES